jgi:Arc/MetJ-type ribon-helix-helix transcriptional regulator
LTVHIVLYIVGYMKVLVELDDDTAKKLERVAPARSRQRSEFIRTAVRRALWEREEEETRRAYEEHPGSDEEHFDPEVWESA